MQTRSKIACVDSVASMLARYAERLPPKGSHLRSRYYRDLMEFTGCNNDTVARWVNGNNMPLGLPLIKLRFFLALVGHEPIELTRLRDGYQFGYMLAETLAFCDNLTVSEASKAIGYTDDYAVLRIAHGESTADAAHEPQLKKFCEGCRADVEKRRSAWILKLSGTPGAEYPREKAPVVCGVPQTQVAVDKEELLRTAAHLVFALEPMMRAAAHDLSSEDRKRLRAMTESHEGNTNAIFELSTYLNMLCSERAREEILGTQRVPKGQ